MKRNKNIWKAAGILVLGILLGYLIFGGANEKEPEEGHEHSELAENQTWTCSMHPSVRQNEPGDCPICGMDLIPLAENENTLDSDVFVMSENAMKLANVETLVIGEQEANKEIRLNGKVSVDERNTYTQSTHIPGRIERLYVNFTGERVNKGQVLASVYSPDLVTAQEELLQAAEIKKNQPELFEAAKQKLRNWKISENQINKVLSNGKAIERFSITADVGGVVTELLSEQGDYLERGMPIYEIANLDKLWVLFDVYEGNMSWIEEGSKVNYTMRSIPGETFEGEISFVDPLLSDKTRVANARVEITNKDKRIKPGVFATGIIEKNLDSKNNKIVVPKSAILWTGKRSLVYVKQEVQAGAGFKLREVVLGTSLGDSFVVEEGLQKGEEIVVHGTFTVDAAVQLQGKNSMMNQSEKEKDPAQMKMNLPITFQEKLSNTLPAYFDLKDAFVNTDAEGAKAAASKMHQQLERLNVSNLGKMEAQHIKKIKSMLEAISESSDIEQQRQHFEVLSENIIVLVSNIETLETPLYIQHCPMVNNNKGANWLSLSEEIRNPYFGDEMMNCGDTQRKL
ncbi:membrane fusion protein, Cu(I)/Ag(I) efflux system [Salegentibacter holothuriorum]|uniref:Membrane fusion protein, Cu(I)/Ag(I) efflux system n=1 Tax=Salegentibacter holothuriorum TaxID=241145 RepID=A0A1T5BCU5_9FLAO|nr:efflux RND transporter periplasmic adaptor subunit [Salegentibacter holothuriorum]SKB44887.1 membrane fusion protein, Cu(I)/Ag(I) efflux system [Salegentibacter holothuriorum]